MKYEAVFGDQKRFNEQNNEMAEVMLWHDCLGPNFVSIKELSRMNLEGAIPHVSVVLAMRRIIAEPKRWTVEDQKAGRLPDVGCIVEYFNNNEHDGTEVTAQWRNGDELEILRHQNKNKAFVVFNARTERSSDLIVQCMKPIETPEEKTARLRSEWINKAYVDFHRLGCELEVLQKEQIKQIYDALLSGELPVPVKDGE